MAKKVKMPKQAVMKQLENQLLHSSALRECELLWLSQLQAALIYLILWSNFLFYDSFLLLALERRVYSRGDRPNLHLNIEKR